MSKHGKLPAPFTTPEIDVRDLDGFMLNIERLLASELVAIGTPEGCWAALMLWCRAWKQIPAGSLPDSEQVIRSFSGARRRWPKVREIALHGFVLCSDGRWYHRVLCEEAKRAYERKKSYQARRATDRDRLNRWREGQKETAHATPHETRFDTRFVAEDKGQGRKKESKKEIQGSSLRAGARLNGAAIKQRKRDFLLQKLIRFANATMSNDTAVSAIAGLMSDDAAEAKRWFELLDGQMRQCGWNDH